MSKHSSGAPAIPARYRDALDRAWRTFKQGILTDALIAAGGGILTLTNQMEPTSTQFWAAAGALVLKSFLVSTASYLHRLKTPPKIEG